VSEFAYLDEFYPTIDFGNGAGCTPILTARLHTQYRGKAVFEDPAQQKTIGWAYERTGGGRSFGYTGLHYLEALENQQLRKVVLNAIMWTSRGDVPAVGMTTTLQDPHRVVLKASEAQNEPVPWGKLVWFASRPLGNSDTMTVGRATVPPGGQNPAHWHPNTDEILHVLQGRIMHRVGDQEYEMQAGDTVTIPAGTVHNARNIGAEDAVLSVTFNSADRYSIGE
jgi:quercetin dioxygenase-like cupin family protein